MDNLVASKDYSLPAWAASASASGIIEPFSLEVLKDGIISNKIDLPMPHNRSCYTLGRQEDSVDIFLAHASISRTHAIMQYRNDGALLLFDNNSAHGTSINKKAIEKGVHHRLYVGDMIKFGASTRLYIVNGPESQTLSAKDASTAPASANVVSSSSTDKQSSEDMDAGFSWGQSYEESQEEHEERDQQEQKQSMRREELELPDYLQGEKGSRHTLFESSLNKADIHKKDMALYEKVKVKEAKIQNLQKENQRIHAKENTQDDGLTSGQQSTLARNDTQVEKLQKEIETMTSTIRRKVGERSGQGTNTDMIMKGQNAMLESFYEDDAIRDLTEESGKRKKRRFGKAPTATTTSAMTVTVQETHAVPISNSSDGVIDLKVLKSMPPLDIEYNPPATSHFDLSMDMNRLLALQDDVEYKIADYNKVIQSNGSYLGQENNMSGGGLRSGDGDFNDEINKLLGQDVVKMAREENTRLMDEYREISQKVVITKRHMNQRNDVGQKEETVRAVTVMPTNSDDAVSSSTASVSDNGFEFMRPSLPMPQRRNNGHGSSATSTTENGNEALKMAPPVMPSKRKANMSSSLSAVLHSQQALQNNNSANVEEAGAGAEKEVDMTAQWSIPQGQSGDGATSLNRKYNY